MARQRKGFKQGFVRRTQQEAAEIDALEAAIAAGAPAPGTNVVGSAAQHPSDAPEPTAATQPPGNGHAKGGSRQQAQTDAKQARIAGSTGTSTSGQGNDAGGAAAQQAGYAYAKLFTELPLSQCTQVTIHSLKILLLRY